MNPRGPATSAGLPRVTGSSISWIASSASDATKKTARVNGMTLVEQLAFETVYLKHVNVDSQLERA